jgi:hypothetical protein
MSGNENAIRNANVAQPAMVGFKQCGCCVAVDLDAHIGTKLEWKRKGYEIRMMPKPDAIALLKSSLCFHR